MATAPDLSTVTSSAQIFSANYTLPQIRSLHKSLHAQAEDKANRLRTQVGGSYRELLGTADTIVRMRSDNERLQELLGQMADRCGSQVVARKMDGLAKLKAAGHDAEMGRAARWKLLEACELVVGRELRQRGQGLVLAAKAWVLERLLVKSVAEEDAARAKGAKRTLSTLRRRLVASINKVLEQVRDDTDVDHVLEALCAYSLVTSSGAKDVMRHFVAVRKEAMGLALSSQQEHHAVGMEESVVASLKLYSQTLLNVQALVPEKLAPALASLKGGALLDDDALKQLQGLRLDIYGGWCSDEVRCFTPFIRHDDLDGKQAKEMLDAWDSQSSKLLVDGLSRALEHMTDLKAIMDLRTCLVQLWIQRGSRIRGIDASDMQDELRRVMNGRLLALIQGTVSKLHLVASEVKATLDSWHEGVSDKHVSLWEDDGYEAALASGAGPFVHEIVARLYGRNDAVSRALGCYTSWLQVTDAVRSAVAQLSQQRWENDVDEVEEEEVIVQRQQRLSKDDPHLLTAKLDACIDDGFVQLGAQIDALWHEHAAAAASGAMAMYLVRVLRDIRSQLPRELGSSLSRFGLASVPALHSRIVAHLCTEPLAAFAAALRDDGQERRVQGRVLWEGDAALPNQPSPTLFALLHALSSAMAQAGSDLWTRAAVATLKRHVCAQVCCAWEEQLHVFEAGGQQSVVPRETDNDEGFAPRGKSNKVASLDEASGQQSPAEHDAEPVSQGEADAENQATAPGQDASPDNEPLTSKSKASQAPPDDNVPALTLTAQDLQNLAIQWVFDLEYLLSCIGNMPASPGPELTRIEDLVFAHTRLDSLARQRIAQAAKNYWHRTNLLFGLLA
ncbi:hypothetical protein CDD81_6766 [Ophiocordyceps australis]|uniref:Conserved oligomeric Golgi complex subunit 1 n=1 Tax=Ophiocordyceps australis TaxID=1399860 RepID=A0A2C5Y1Y7_9HYPO|nr:hypothetical protein CDD81_6766 [Ophiocordyceps australis]